MAHDNTDRFARNLAKLCKGYGNARRISTAAGITADHLWRITTGKTVPGLDVAWRLAEAVGLSVDELSTVEIEDSPVKT